MIELYFRLGLGIRLGLRLGQGQLFINRSVFYSSIRTEVQPGTATHARVQPRVRCSTVYRTMMIELYFRLGLGITLGLRLGLG